MARQRAILINSHRIRVSVEILVPLVLLGVQEHIVQHKASFDPVDRLSMSLSIADAKTQATQRAKAALQLAKGMLGYDTDLGMFVVELSVLMGSCCAALVACDYRRRQCIRAVCKDVLLAAE